MGENSIKSEFWEFIYDVSFDQFDTWEILGSGPVRFVHGENYSVLFESQTYFLVYGRFSGRDKWTTVDMVSQGWACDIMYADKMKLFSPHKKWIFLCAL